MEAIVVLARPSLAMGVCSGKSVEIDMSLFPKVGGFIIETQQESMCRDFT